MKAGIDFGSSLVKAAWKNDGEWRFASTADTPLEDISRRLGKEGITRAHIAGIGYSEANAEHFRDFEMRRGEGDPIEQEVQLQAEGTKQLLEEQGYQGENFLVVSIGTGTSYTLVTRDSTTRFPLGNSLGGGFIHGLGRVLGALDYQEIATAEGASLDLCIKDMLPDKKGTLKGELVVAHFGKGTADSPRASTYASAMSTVAAATIRDILLLGMIPDFQPPQDVVYVGSTVARTPLLQYLLSAYSAAIGKNAHFPAHGEYALAVGAYHRGK